MEEVRQLEKVVAFHDELSAKGLVGEYDDPAMFADVVRPHLLLALRRHLSVKSTAGDKARHTPPAVLPNALETAKQDLLALARGYERARDEMPWGRERTKKMGGIFVRMRAIAASAHPLLPSLAASDSPGERLAAVGILLELPRLDYVDWLAARPALEKAFGGLAREDPFLVAARAVAGGLTHVGANA